MLTVLAPNRGPMCDRCGCTMEVVEDCGNGVQVLACLYCDILHQPSQKPYINHCWNCRTVIDSRRCPKSDLPDMGYHCLNCGEDLRKIKGYFHVQRPPIGTFVNTKV